MIPAQLKQAFKSKTVQYGVAIAVLSVLQGFVGFSAYQSSDSGCVGLRYSRWNCGSAVHDHDACV